MASALMAAALMTPAFAAMVACGPGAKPASDLEVRDTPGAPARPAPQCAENCQTVDWVGRAPLAALRDIAPCLDLPIYAPPSLSGSVTIYFRNLPCRDAVARVAAAAGVSAEIGWQGGRRAVLFRSSRIPGEQLVLVSPGDGWNPAGGGGRDGPAGPGRTRPGSGGDCAEACERELRACMHRCGWERAGCAHTCDERHRSCDERCGG